MTRDLHSLREVVDEAKASRATDASELLGASEFSDDGMLRDPVALIEALKGCPEIWPDLQEGTTDPVEWERRQTGSKHVVGGNRMEGDAILLTIPWMLSKEAPITFLAEFVLKNPEIIEAAGFDHVPSRGTLPNRILELEGPMCGAIEEATKKLWLIAQSHQPEIGRHVHVDFTAHQTNAKGFHACLDHDWCMANGGDKMPKYLYKAPVALVESERQRLNGLPPGTEPEVLLERNPPDSDLEEQVVQEAAEADPSHPKYAKHGYKAPRQEAGVYWSDDHRYVCMDPDAGGRKIRKKWWLGYAKGRATCDTLGISCGTVVVAADVNESDAYDDLIDAVEQRTGYKPEAVAGDKALGRRDVRKSNADNEIATISPHRSPNTHIRDRSWLRTDDHDEYGFVICECCSGPTSRVGIRKVRGRPQLVFRCLDPKTPECERFERRVWCDEESLLFGYEDRESPLYFQLRGIGKSRGEGVHWYGRRRYNDTSKTAETRPYRVGIAHVELRAALADFLDIFRVCLRHGWIGDWPNSRPARVVRRKGGEAAVKSLRRKRSQLGLLLPRGERAIETGWAWDGAIPAGWVPVKQRMMALREQRKLERAEATRGSPPEQVQAA